MADKTTQWKHIGYVAAGLLVFFVVIYFLISYPERRAFNAEKERLERVEQQVIDAITAKNNELAKALIIQLRWQYEPRSAGGIGEADKLRQTWRNKRAEYLRVIGEDPEEFIIDENETGSKGLREQWREFIGE